MAAAWITEIRPALCHRGRPGPSPVYIRQGRYATSGGVTASLDLTLALIEEDHGAELARWVAMGMVTYLQRPGNQAQMSIFTETPHPDDALVQQALDHIVARPEADLRTQLRGDAPAGLQHPVWHQPARLPEHPHPEHVNPVCGHLTAPMRAGSHSVFR